MPGFLAQEQADLFNLYDIIGSRYGILPSEVAKLSWEDLLISVRAIKSRSDRLRVIIKKNRHKKAMVIPNISLSELADLL